MPDKVIRFRVKQNIVGNISISFAGVILGIALFPGDPVAKIVPAENFIHDRFGVERHVFIKVDVN